MPAITATASSMTGCSSCLNQLEALALRCKNCQCFVHLSCSGLPEYILVRLLSTQNSYSCKQCVRTKELIEGKYEEDIDRVRELLANEQAEIIRLNSEADMTTCNEMRLALNQTVANSSSTTNVDSGTAPAGEGDTAVSLRNETVQNSGIVPQTQSSSSAERGANGEGGKNEKPPKVCGYYINRTCKFGPGGNGCKFGHPKMCRSFAKFGDKRRGGCKKGELCNFFHPNLCWQASGGFECNRKNCRFLHPFGIESASKNFKERESPQTDAPQLDNRKRGGTVSPSYAETLRRNQNEVPTVSSPTDIPALQSYAHSSGRSIGNDFLEIRQQLDMQYQTMKLMQQQLTSLMRDGPVNRVRLDRDSSSNYHPRW